MATDKTRDFSKFSDDLKKKAEQLDEEVIARIGEGAQCGLPGQACTNLIEPMPTFDKMECEVVYPTDNGSKNNSYIVFGRDRHTRQVDAGQGYGGRGATGAGMVDIVVGRGFAKHKDIVGPQFFTDAARIYISQRANIDSYFNLPEDKNVGVLYSVNRSAIGMKADAIRIIGREGIRLVTNSRTDTTEQKETNSRGEKLQSAARGIHLIANGRVGNFQTINPKGGVFSVNRLQPLVKGDNLQKCLIELVDQLKDLMVLVQNFSFAQMKYNTYIMTHTHTVASSTGGTATPSIELAMTGPQAAIDHLNNHYTQLSQKVNAIGLIFKENYLSSTSPLSFLSRHNKTN